MSQYRHANRGSKELSNSQRQQGFTLLEVLMAMSIFAILGLASYHLLSGEMHTQKALEQASNSQYYWQRGVLRLTQDLQQAINRSIREDYSDREPAMRGASDSITFTRQGWSNPLHRQRSDLQRVDYRIAAKSDSYYLRRSYWPHLDRSPGSEPVQQLLLPDVQQVQFRYFHQKRKQWLPLWPPLEEPDIGLPQAIEVTLMSHRYGDIQRLVTLTLAREAHP